jgi:hypothetical protein
MPRENVYLLLDLDPGVTDPITLRAALRKKRAEWSAQVNHPTRGRQARVHLEQVPALEALLNDPEQVRIEAEEARRLLREHQAAASRELDDALAVVAAKGFLLPEELAELQRRFQDRFTPEEVARRLPVPVRVHEQPAEPPVLDRSHFQQIQAPLRLLGLPDLYAFLGVESNVSCTTLRQRANDRYAEARNNNNPTAEVKAQQELAGFALDLFRTEETRELYDNTLAAQALLALEPAIRLAGLGGTLHAPVVEQLEQQALARGIPRERARRFILERARELGCSVEVPAGPPLVFRRCPCGRLEPREAETCLSCGQPLEITCPACGTVNLSAQKACRQCGLSVGDLRIHNRLLRDADAALAGGDRDRFRALVDEARTFWRGSPEVVRRVEALRQQERQARDARDGVHLAIESRRFVAARKLLESWRAHNPDDPGIAPAEDKIRVALTRARGHVERARGLPPDQACAEYEQALELCPDLPEAIGGLARCPPMPVVGLEVRWTAGTGVVLTWRPGGGRAPARYRVHRREAKASEWEALATVSQPKYTDTRVEPGAIYSYNVVPCTPEGVLGAAVAGEPVLILGEVSDAGAVAGDGEVTLSWQQPRRVRRVEIYRAEDAVPASPSAPGQAPPGTVLLPRVAGDGYRDAGLENEILHEYRLCCVFTSPQGGEVISPGVVLTATPTAAPPRLECLRIVAAERGVLLTWHNPAGPRVLVIRTDRAPGYPVGERMAREEVEGLAYPLEEAAGSGGGDGALDPAPRATEPCYLVYSLNRTDAAYAGLLRYVDLDRLFIRVEGDQLRILWTWPEGCTGLVVSIDGQVVAEPVRPAEENAHGECTLPLGQVGNGERTIQAVCRVADDSCLAGPGVTETARVFRQRVVRWRLVKRGLFKRTAQVLVECSQDLSDLHRLLVVAGVNQQPDSPREGRILGRWKPDDRAPGPITIDLEPWPAARGEVFCRLFAEPPDGLSFQGPPPEQAVL